MSNRTGFYAIGGMVAGMGMAFLIAATIGSFEPFRLPGWAVMPYLAWSGMFGAWTMARWSANQEAFTADSGAGPCLGCQFYRCDRPETPVASAPEAGTHHPDDCPTYAGCDRCVSGHLGGGEPRG